MVAIESTIPIVHPASADIKPEVLKYIGIAEAELVVNWRVECRDIIRIGIHQIKFNR